MDCQLVLDDVNSTTRSALPVFATSSADIDYYMRI